MTAHAAGKPVLVTGASKGIGKAIALRLGTAGFSVTVHYGHDKAGAEAVAAEIQTGNGTADVIGFDIANREETREALERRTGEAYWGVVANAGITRDNAFPAIDGDAWDAVLHTNLDGLYNVLHPLVMPMIRRRDGGRIVTMSSVSGLIGNRGQVNYSAAKAGIIGATKALAIELAKRNITVNCIAPGIIETAMTEGVPEEIISAIPMRRMGKPEDVASLAAFLFSDDAAYITRQVISVNGGALLMRRVVVTGMGGLTALGGTWPEIRARMEAGQTGTRHMPEWERLSDLNTKIGGAIDWFDHTTAYHRKKTRSMGRVAVMAVNAAEKALAQAGLTDDPVLKSGRVGVSCGSSFGATEPVQDFAGFMGTGKAGSLNATSYIRMMSHTAPVNIAIANGLTGRVITTSSACTSGSQGIGYAFEAVANGHADIMLAGGAEQLCPTMAIVFDTLFATSTSNASPESASKPFDKKRDGLVIGEGAAILVLEELEHAHARGAVPLAEIVAFATNSDGAHVTQPKAETQAIVMREALKQARLSPSDLGFISGHGTATDSGDIAESQASAEAYGARVPLHSLKGHFGHSLGACGAIEGWLSICMMNDGWLPHTANLTEIDPRCAELDYVMHEPRKINAEHFVSNNFAFGGINTSLIFRRV